MLLIARNFFHRADVYPSSVPARPLVRFPAITRRLAFPSITPPPLTPLATRLPPTSPPPSPTLASRPPLHPHAAAAAPSPAASPSRAANPRRPGRSAPSLLLLRSARMLLRPRAPYRRATPPTPRTLASPATEPLFGLRLKPGDSRRIQQQCWWRPPWRR